MTTSKKVWVARDHIKCTGCRKCEIACSLKHEGKIWPEASRIRVFMLVPGAEFPHFCAQCEDYPCVKACKFNALSVSKVTDAVLVNEKKCTACGACIRACPGNVPHMHPTKKTIVICDLCDGKPECAKVCQEAGWGVLKTLKKGSWRPVYRVYSRKPEDVTKELVSNLYGEAGEALT